MLLRLIIHAHIGGALTVFFMWDYGLLSATLAAPLGASVFAALMAMLDLATGVYPARSAGSAESDRTSSPALPFNGNHLDLADEARLKCAPELSREQATSFQFTTSVRKPLDRN
ncbi:MAG: hypothetical protein Q8M31_07765 [Beijerinckiaceae bacterium]|nr:hypothetical protein [Beijerinckiaceae bacterium]